MIGNKSIWKRIGSGAIALCLVAALFPASAFAADSSLPFAAIHMKLNPDGSYGEALSSEELTIQEGNYLESTADGKIDLWVTAKEEPYQIPHVEDKSVNTWYLQNISLVDQYPTPTETQLVMDADAIKKADSIDDYILDPATASIGAWYDTAYLVYYGWTTTSPDQWGEDSNDAETYTVNYNLNCPSGVDSISIIGQNGFPRQEGAGYNGVPEAVDNLNGKTVQEGLNFKVADGLDAALDEDDLKGFLAYNINDSNSQSYFFGGWQDKTGEVYPCNEIVTATKELEGKSGIIEFTGVWREILLYTDTELEDIEKSVPLNVFTGGVNGNLLISQSTDTLTKENNGISYTVSAGINNDLLSKDGGVAFKGDAFATFEIIVKVDPNLEFANRNEDDTVTLRMASNLIVPQNIEMKSGAVNWIGNDGSWTVSFDPDELPSNEGEMQIIINAAFTDQNYKNFSDKMTLTGLDFKLKEGAFDAGGEVPEVKTSANMTAQMDLSKIAGPDGIFNTRFRYYTLQNLLTNNTAWREYFANGLEDPTAYMHALQFLDYKLADYDLNADTTATLKANTETAKIFESEPIEVTPADITIYMGGDGGYDAVVGENGTTSSNSLPHPLFTIDAPNGVDPVDLTFTNGKTGEEEKTWTLVCANPDSTGTKYYYFQEGDGQDKVRVTYTDKNGTEHISDAFDPSAVHDVYTTYTIALYPGDNDIDTITAKDTTNREYFISAKTGTLTVRAVADNKPDDDPTIDVIDESNLTKVESGKAVAVAPAGTTYTLNNTGVKLPEDSKPSLLFDSIIEDEGSTARTDALEDKVDDKLGEVGSNTTRHYEIKYLDLVDANNGNAWITSSAGTDIYWGYPETTGQGTTFKLLHFKDLHRDGTNSGFELTDISSINPNDIEIIDVENTENGIKFHVDAGGFSPFALVWETRNSSGGGGTVTPEPDPKPDPDDTGVSDWLETDQHNAFLSGYPDSSFHADQNMTRAEVAQMFYALLLNKDVKITTSFSDVSEEAWYSTAVNTLASLGMLSGYPDGTFRPDEPITRAEFATVALAFAYDPTTASCSYTDVSTGAWYYTYVAQATTYGWIGGYPDGSFRPNNSITRAEVCVIVNNMLGREADENYIDRNSDELVNFMDLSSNHWAYYNIMEATNTHDYTSDSAGETWNNVK